MFLESLANATRTGALKKLWSGLWVTVTSFHILSDYREDREKLAIPFYYLYFLTIKPRCQAEN